MHWGRKILYWSNFKNPDTESVRMAMAGSSNDGSSMHSLMIPSCKTIRFSPLIRQATIKRWRFYKPIGWIFCCLKKRQWQMSIGGSLDAAGGTGVVIFFKETQTWQLLFSSDWGRDQVCRSSDRRLVLTEIVLGDQDERGGWWEDLLVHDLEQQFFQWKVRVVPDVVLQGFRLLGYCSSWGSVLCCRASLTDGCFA